MYTSQVVKQTVMTSVYGVTFIGARMQILSRLKEKYEAGVLGKTAGQTEEEAEKAVYGEKGDRVVI